MRPPIEEVGPTVVCDAAFEGGQSVGPAFDQRLPQYFTWHLIERRRRFSVESGFRDTRQPSLKAGARSATGRGEGLNPLRIRR